jgi:HTH-type transcriptional regulator/antitoxin HigA
MEPATMNTLAVRELAAHFDALNREVPLRPVRNDADHAAAVAALERLLDAGAADEAHPLADLAATLGELIGDYEDRQPQPRVSGLDLLRFLMQQHGLSQSGLPEIGSQGVVSEILAGKRALNLRHARALAQRFGTSVDVFV